jgi:hypothetical protein
VQPEEKLHIDPEVGPEGMDPVEVKAGQDGGSLDVKLELPDIQDASDLELLVVPLQKSYSGPAVVPLNGAQLARLAPGDYVVYTLHGSDMQKLEYHNPDALRPLVPSANVNIEPFGHRTISIRNLSE